MNIQMHMSVNGRDVKFLSEPAFVIVKNTLDSRMKQLTSQGHRARQM
jgi:hypothetical protein